MARGRDTDLITDTKPPRGLGRVGAGFTLIELIAVIVVLAVLASVAVPRYFDYADDARDSATEGAVGGIMTALLGVFLDQQERNAPASEYIISAAQVASAMETGALPEGVTINGAGRLVFPNGEEYRLIPQTSSYPARLTLHTP